MSREFPLAEFRLGFYALRDSSPAADFERHRPHPAKPAKSPGLIASAAPPSPAHLFYTRIRGRHPGLFRYLM